MIERFVDKKIRVLEEICKDDFKSNDITNYSLGITEDQLTTIIRWELGNFLKIVQSCPLDLSGDNPDYDDSIYIVYKITNKDELVSLLSKLKKEYPKHTEPFIREKTLELIAKDIGEFETGTKLIDFLKKCGVEKELIIYPSTKWKMIYDILVYLSSSARKEDGISLHAIIEESIHPLMHNGDMAHSQSICDKFNQYLVYDGYEIYYSQQKKKFVLTYIPTEEEENEFAEEQLEIWQSELEERLEFLKKPENKEKIAIIRKAYQVLINIIETFCENPTKPTAELNDAFIKVKELSRRNASELEIIGRIKFPEYHLHNFYIPFSNLFSAEVECRKRKQKIDWNEIRPELHCTYGEIDALFREVNGSDILSEPNIQKILNDASLLVSEAKNKTQSLKSERKVPAKTEDLLGAIDNALIRGFNNMFTDASAPLQQPIHKIEIIKGKMEVEGLQEGLRAISKNKQVDKYKFPYSIPAGTEWKSIIFQFKDNENVYIQVKQHKHYVSFREMGFIGKGKKPKPSEAWNFLKVLSMLNGEIGITDSKAKTRYKKQKEILSKMLKSYFSIDSDPFYPYDQSKTYRIKMTLIPPTNKSQNEFNIDNKEENDELGINEYLKEQAPEVFEG